jgi:molybdate transport system ATP-binding protein
VSLDADFRVRQGDFELDLALTAGEGEVVALLGPNGAGKTTALRALAGLLPIDEGHIALGDGDARVELDRAGGEATVFVPPERRRVGVVFQDHLLFGHLTAVQNVAFGLRAARVPRREALDRARAALDHLGLGGVAGQRAGTLSGGQAQRVALARALVTEPRILLLDEPLAALDAGARDEVRRALRRVLGETSAVRILVTHDPVDAHVLADRVVVLERGRVVQEGTLAEVTAHPRSRHVADLVGVNLVPGTVRAGDGGAGSASVLTAEGATIVVAPDAVEGLDGHVWVVIPPTAVALHRERPAGSPRNAWRCTVADLDRRDGRVRVVLAGPVPLVAEVLTSALAELDVRPGDEVWAAVKATELRVTPG